MKDRSWSTEDRPRLHGQNHQWRRMMKDCRDHHQLFHHHRFHHHRFKCLLWLRKNYLLNRHYQRNPSPGLAIATELRMKRGMKKSLSELFWAQQSIYPFSLPLKRNWIEIFCLNICQYWIIDEPKALITLIHNFGIIYITVLISFFYTWCKVFYLPIPKLTRAQKKPTSNIIWWIFQEWGILLWSFMSVFRVWMLNRGRNEKLRKNTAWVVLKDDLDEILLRYIFLRTSHKNFAMV